MLLKCKAVLNVLHAKNKKLIITRNSFKVDIIFKVSLVIVPTSAEDLVNIMLNSQLINHVLLVLYK